MQLNFKTPAGTLINLYAEDAAMLSAQLQELEGLHTQVKIVEEVLGMGATATIQAPATPGADGSPQCKHGARIHRTGTGKTGKQWSAWFCPTPKGTEDQCEPQWQR